MSRPSPLERVRTRFRALKRRNPHRGPALVLLLGAVAIVVAELIGSLGGAIASAMYTLLLLLGGGATLVGSVLLVRALPTR